MKLLKTPRCLPRPLHQDQVCRLERCIQAAINNAQTEYQRQLIIRDLACFYLLWHCGLRISEVCPLLVNDVDLPGRKLFIRNSKERKDRLVYLSETAVEALRHNITIRPDPSSAYLFITRLGVLKRGGFWKRLRTYGHHAESLSQHGDFDIPSQARCLQLVCRYPLCNVIWVTSLWTLQ